MVVFIIGSILTVGSIFVWSRNNGEAAKAPDTNQSFLNLNLPGSSQKQGQSNAQQAQQQQDQQQQQAQQVTHLLIEDVQVGTGSAVKSGDNIEVNYTGTFLDGKKFDSSYDRGQTFSFKVGVGEVIAGWDQGILGMKIGGKRRLVVPADLAYGSSGNQGIPPNSPLIFDVELVNIK